MIEGDRVRLSPYALRGSRDYWQKQGRFEAKQRAKEAYEKKLAKRGTITEVNNGYTIKWDDGTISSCVTGYVVSVNSLLFRSES